MKIINSVLELTALNLHEISCFVLQFNIEQFQGFTKWSYLD